MVSTCFGFKAQAISSSRGGKNSKIHVLLNERMQLLNVILTGGHIHDSEPVFELFDGIKLTLRDTGQKFAFRTKQISKWNTLQFAYKVFIVDSFPLAACKFGCAHFCKLFRADGTAYGYNPSKKQTYFSFKVHVLTTSDGASKAFEITPTNVDDRKPLHDLSLLANSGSVFLVDKGYVSEKLAQKLQTQGQTLLALKRNNSCQPYSLQLRKEIFSRRRRIETTFSQLSCQLNFQRVLAKSFTRLALRLLTKFLVSNLCLLERVGKR